MWSRMVDFPNKNVTSQQHKYTKTYKYFLCVYMKNTLYFLYFTCANKVWMNLFQVQHLPIYSKMGKLMQYRMSELSTLHFLVKNVQFAKKREKIQKTWTYIMHLQNIEHNQIHKWLPNRESLEVTNICITLHWLTVIHKTLWGYDANE